MQNNTVNTDNMNNPVDPLLLKAIDLVSGKIEGGASTSQIISMTKEIYDGLKNLTSSQVVMRADKEPAVPIEQSVTDDYIVCLEDGKKMKMLKRHLRTYFNMTVDQYRARWGLPADYPVVAPSFSARKNAIAKSIGLGKHDRRKDMAAKQA